MSWPLTRLDPPLASVSVSRAGSAVLALWKIDPEPAAAIATGRYELIARVDTTTATAGWKGTLEARASATVTPKRDTSAQSEASRALARSRHFADVGDWNRALAEAEVAVAAGESIPSLAARAQALLRLHRFAEAHDDFQKALALSIAINPNPVEPPVPLLRGDSEALEGMNAQAP